MHGARDAIAGGLVHIEAQVNAIEQAVIENPGLAFDLAKTLVESVCRAVLGDRTVPFSEADDLPKLFKTVSRSLPFLPMGARDAAEVRQSLARTLNGLHTAVQGICELRNQCGFTSHGSGTPRPIVESIQALLAAEAADAIIGFLHRVHLQDSTLPSTPGASYEANPAFNESVDDIHGVIQIFGIELLPSKVLFQMEPDTYRLSLAEFDSAAATTEGDAAPGGPKRSCNDRERF
jgi:hypothetical protein